MTLQQTPSAGRSLFAGRNMPPGTSLLSTDRPFCSTVLSKYRKEVCTWCFAFADGSTFKIRQDGLHGGLRWFCADACRAAWRVANDQVGIESVGALDEPVRKRRKIANEHENGRVATLDEVGRRWQHIDALSLEVVKLRNSSIGSKANKRRLVAIAQDYQLREEDDEEDLRFILDGLITTYHDHSRFRLLQSLVPTLSMYVSATTGTARLESHARMTITLALHLPLDLLTSVSLAETVLTIITRDVGNSFGIWEPLGRSANGIAVEAAQERSTRDEQKEWRGPLIGYALYPLASFFNHSCDPSVHKYERLAERRFETARDVVAGEELTISYLGNGRITSAMPLAERQRLLKDGWGFDCACALCTKQNGEQTGNGLDGVRESVLVNLQPA